MASKEDCFLEILDIESGDTYYYYSSDYYQEMFDAEFETLFKIIEEMEPPYVLKRKIRRAKSEN